MDIILTYCLLMKYVLFFLNFNESYLKDLYDSVSIPRAEQHSFLRAIYA